MLEKLRTNRKTAGALLLALMLPLGLAAADDEEEEPRIPRTFQERWDLAQEIAKAPYTEDGADECLKCHDTEAILPIFKTEHAVVADDGTPAAGRQCEACHGPGGNHAGRVRRGQVRPPILNFGQNAWTPIQIQNEKCLQCHEDHERIEWKGSSHAAAGVACTGCHQLIHVVRDPVLVPEIQDQVCFQCHLHQRIDFHKAFHHPVREDELACTDCHDPHGEDGSDLMLASRSRQNCTSCHADKRGPFLWEHAPAAEDCTICHEHHGSNHPSLLKKRPPHLCQECHSQFDHPSTAYSGAAVRGLSPSRFAALRGCLNCHSQVHGSNHPSGVTRLR